MLDERYLIRSHATQPSCHACHGAWLECRHIACIDVSGEGLLSIKDGQCFVPDPSADLCKRRGHCVFLSRLVVVRLTIDAIAEVEEVVVVVKYCRILYADVVPVLRIVFVVDLALVTAEDHELIDTIAEFRWEFEEVKSRSRLLCRNSLLLEGLLGSATGCYESAVESSSIQKGRLLQQMSPHRVQAIFHDGLHFEAIADRHDWAVNVIE